MKQKKDIQMEHTTIHLEEMTSYYEVYRSGIGIKNYLKK